MSSKTKKDKPERLTVSIRRRGGMRSSDIETRTVRIEENTTSNDDQPTKKTKKRKIDEIPKANKKSRRDSNGKDNYEVPGEITDHLGTKKQIQNGADVEEGEILKGGELGGKKNSDGLLGEETDDSIVFIGEFGKTNRKCLSNEEHDDSSIIVVGENAPEERSIPETSVTAVIKKIKGPDQETNPASKTPQETPQRYFPAKASVSIGLSPIVMPMKSYATIGTSPFATPTIVTRHDAGINTSMIVGSTPLKSTSSSSIPPPKSFVATSSTTTVPVSSTAASSSSVPSAFRNMPLLNIPFPFGPPSKNPRVRNRRGNKKMKAQATSLSSIPLPSGPPPQPFQQSFPTGPFQFRFQGPPPVPPAPFLEPNLHRLATQNIRNFQNPQMLEAYRLRPIIIDGSNVARAYGNGKVFECKAILLCARYFIGLGHRVRVFVPRIRDPGCPSTRTNCPTINGDLLIFMKDADILTFTPHRNINTDDNGRPCHRSITFYDDNFIVEYAHQNSGVIVSNDNYRDVSQNYPAWARTINNGLLMYSWVGDTFMPARDPLGKHGPSLEQFLRFGNGESARQPLMLEESQNLLRRIDDMLSKQRNDPGPSHRERSHHRR